MDELNIAGKRKARFLQWLTDEGQNMLLHQIGRVQRLLEMCGLIDSFKSTAKKQKSASIAPYLFDDINKIAEWETDTSITERLLLQWQ